MTDSTNKGGAPLGNDNEKRGLIIKGAIRRALAKGNAEGRNRLNNVIDRMIADAENGDAVARREFFDRLDGKPAQAISIDGDGEGGPIKTVNRIELVDLGPGSTPAED